MHIPTTTTLLLIAFLSLTRVHAEELEAKDVPSACTAICGPIVTLTGICDVNPDTDNKRRRDVLLRKDDESDEAVEAQCICSNTSFNVRSVAALCAACIKQNGKGSDGKGTTLPGSFVCHGRLS